MTMININPPIKVYDFYVDRLDTAHYGNGRLAVQAYTTDGEPAATVSVNLPDAPLNEGEFFLKDWSENEIISKALIERNIIEVLDRPLVKSGFVQVRTAKLVAKS